VLCMCMCVDCRISSSGRRQTV